ncbi:hypothetical protein [Nonomuraea cavernae]|uniref:Uncharacterized protein n=1 Tax=Nonomuraea cavernae TaxID=2045107 RepID=A0A917YXJ7_9ACTN|nr:hypothetical protein [Nonomuraea cavernae]GGO67509.1 hypothetical protein GCM10012289_24100 [Nonomuraea cavernae]
MIAMILLIALMIIAIAAMELVMRCTSEQKECVESPAEIVGD